MRSFIHWSLLLLHAFHMLILDHQCQLAHNYNVYSDHYYWMCVYYMLKQLHKLRINSMTLSELMSRCHWLLVDFFKNDARRITAAAAGYNVYSHIMHNTHHVNTTKCYVVSYYQVPGSLVVVIDIFLSLLLNIMSSVSGSLAYNNSNTYHTSKGGHSKANFTLCSFKYSSIWNLSALQYCFGISSSPLDSSSSE